jgi:hypothetical protein
MNVRRQVLFSVLAIVGLVAWPARAQEGRDPTRAPAEVLAMPDAAAVRTPWGTDGVAVVVRDGKPYLVSGTRLYGVGQQIGGFRIERIAETEVWLRSGNQMRKLPRFTGIQRKPFAEPTGPKP